MRLLSLLFAAALALAAPEAVAQSSVLQAGTPTGGHAPMYSYGSGGQAIIRDSGAASGGAAGTGLNELLLQILGTGTAPYANAGTGPLSTNNCNYDAPTTNSTGYHYLCSSPNAQGGGLIAYGAGGAASALPFKLMVNGETITLGGSGWLSTLLDSQFSSTQGSILYRGASAWAALAPGASGTVLKSGGASGNPSWGTTGGVGTVTSITCGVGLTGGIITSTGTCDLTVPVIVAYGGTGATTLTANAVVLGQGSSAVAFAAPGIAGTCLASNGVGADPSFQSCPGTGTVASITAGNGITMSPNPLVVSGTVNVSGAAGQILAGATPALTAAPTLGVNATTSGTLGLANGGALGATVTIRNNSATSAYNWNLPATAGSSGNILASAGGGASPMTWFTTSGSGTVLALTNSPSFTTPAIGAATGASLAVTGQLTSTVATGTAPLVVSSTTVVANLNASTLTGSAVGTSGATIPLLSAANTWSGVQGYNTGKLALNGSVSGTLAINAAASAGTNTLTFPAGTTDFSATGGTGQVIKQNGLGAAFTVATLAASDLSNGTTGSGAVMLAGSPTTTGTLTAAAITASGQITSSVSTGTAPFVVASTTNVANLNASSLSGATFASPGAIGGTVASAITGTTITANTAFRGTDVGSGSTSSVNFTTSGGTQFQIGNTASSVNFITVTGSGTGGGVVQTFTGSDATVTGLINTKGATGTLYLQVGSNTVHQNTGVASAVNFWQWTNAATGNAPVGAVVGSDTDIGWNRYTKGAGVHRFYTAAGANEQFSIGPSGAITIPLLATDATHTDRTVCQDTTSKTLFFGSGAVGICLGTSSARFKNNIIPLHEGLGEIMGLRAISYRYKPEYGDPDHDLFGFTAEEVGGVLPRLVRPDPEGRPNSVDMVGMIPVLVRAIQEQQAEIDTLKAANDNSWWGSVKRAVGWR